MSPLSIDPVLMIRMLILGYVFAVRSERLLCREVQEPRWPSSVLADNLARVMNIHRHQALIAAIRA